MRLNKNSTVVWKKKLTLKRFSYLPTHTKLRNPNSSPPTPTPTPCFSPCFLWIIFNDHPRCYMRSTSFQENLTCKVTTWIMQQGGNSTPDWASGFSATRLVSETKSWLGFSFFSFRNPYGSWHLIHNPLISTLADIVYSGPWLVGKESNSFSWLVLHLTFVSLDFSNSRAWKKRVGQWF